MKRLLFAVLMLLCIGAKSQGRQYVMDLQGGDYVLPALVDTPIGYNSHPTQTYPLLMFLHGRGQSSQVAYNNAQYLAGDDLNDIYGSSTAGGPAYFIAANGWPDSFRVAGKGAWQHFIVVSPQAQGTNNSPTGPEIPQMITSLLKQGIRINVSQIYLTGLSGGGEAMFDYITSDLAFYDSFPCAAIVPMSMQIGIPTNAEVDTVLSYNLQVWGFGSESDVYGIQTHLFITGSYSGNNGPTPPALGKNGFFVAYTGGHCCWGQFYDPTYTDTVDGSAKGEMSIYQWMLQYSRPIGTDLPVNFLSFVGQEYTDSTVLNWETAQEEHVSHYVIERSTDGQTWTDIGSVPSQATNGTSAQPLFYSYTYKHS